jgi:hypothetical protein
VVTAYKRKAARSVLASTQSGATANTARVTRLGELSPIRQLFTLGTLWKIIEIAGYFFHGKSSVVLILAKQISWATIWAIF